MEIEEAKRRARVGPAIFLLRRVFSILITFLSTITIARLLSPRDYGLAAMAAMLLSLGQIFRDFGLTNAILRKGFISEEEMSLIFWCNCVFTVAIAVILAIASPFVAEFYHEPVVKWVILVSLIGFLCDGFALQHRALLSRELRFGTTAAIDAGSLFIGFVVSLGLAIEWRSVWAIVLGTLAQVVSSAVLSVSLSGWRPSRPKRSNELRSLLKFGANTSVFSIGLFLSQNAGSVLIGHFLGTASLGQYNRAQALFQLPTSNLIQPLTQTVMPLLTRLRANEDEYREAYLSLVRKICSFLIPVSIALAFAAVPLVQTLLGPRWHHAGLVLAALSPALVGTGFAYSAADLFITQDRSAELRVVGLYEVVLRVAGVAIGSIFFGLIGTAVGYSISTNLVAFLRVYVSGRKGPVTARQQLMAGAPAVPMAVGTAIACASVMFLSHVIPMTNSMLVTAIFSAGALGALAVGLPIRASRLTLIELAESFGITKGYRFVSRLRGS